MRAGFIRVEEVHGKRLASLLKEFIDEDEAEAITLALEINADILLIDDRDARGLARRNNWIQLSPVIYTIAVPVRPGNVYIEPEVFGAYLSSIIKHFIEFGQRKFVIVLGHGGSDIKTQ